MRGTENPQSSLEEYYAKRAQELQDNPEKYYAERFQELNEMVEKRKSILRKHLLTPGVTIFRKSKRFK